MFLLFVVNGLLLGFNKYLVNNAINITLHQNINTSKQDNINGILFLKFSIIDI